MPGDDLLAEGKPESCPVYVVYIEIGIAGIGLGMQVRQGGAGVGAVREDGGMPDLSVLSGVEFEELCRDLFAAELGVPVASFAAGPDGGVDLRWTTVSGRRAVGQCKHYARSGSDTLLRSLRGHELAKVQALAPDEYWVATSVEMTPERKEKVYGLFRAWMPGPDCVLGANDIEGLVRRHPEVLRHNLKLLLGDSERLAALLRCWPSTGFASSPASPGPARARWRRCWWPKRSTTDTS